tara:strand:+ start:7800 stop:7925 length:126 start_codon:yes stop_codon:yes gene_type:complete
MDLLPSLAFFIGAAYLAHRLGKLDKQIRNLQKKIEEHNAQE